MFTNNFSFLPTLVRKFRLFVICLRSFGKVDDQCTEGTETLLVITIGWRKCGSVIVLFVGIQYQHTPKDFISW